MSEIPERETLKEILPKLRLKALESEKLFTQSVNLVLLKHSEIIDGMKKNIIELKGSSKPVGMILLGIAEIEEGRTKLLVVNATNVINDLKIYIELLEKYSSELDKAFWKGIEKKSKELIRQIEQQEKAKKEQNPLSV